MENHSDLLKKFWEQPSEDPLESYKFVFLDMSNSNMHVGKLKLFSMPASYPKLFIDEMNQVFQVDYRSGQKRFMFHVYQDSK